MSGGPTQRKQSSANTRASVTSETNPQDATSGTPPVGTDIGPESGLQHGPEACAALAVPARPNFATLIALLDDDSPRVWAGVRRQLRRAGKAAVPALRRASEHHDPRVRGRARSILAERERRVALRRLYSYLASKPIRLETGLFLMARLSDPRLDARAHQRALNAMADELIRRGKTKTDEFDRAALLPGYLGRELGFGGSKGEFHHPDNVHLHRALERRAGLPLTLSALYHLVAERAGIRTGLLALPGHVMLRLYGSGKSVILDPFQKGVVRSEKDCRKYLAQNGLDFNPAWMRDATPGQMLRRQLLNLRKSAELRGRRSEVRELDLAVRLLQRNPHAKALER